jgi:hypothetical protein
MHPEEVIAALRFEPLLPLWAIAALSGLALLVVVLAAMRRARGTAWRLAGFAVLLLWLAGPRLVQETRENLTDIGLLVVDQTASMQIGERARLAEAARAKISQQATKLPDLELRTITVPESGDSGTRLFAAIDRALADIPRSRLAGTIAITDGQVHDIPDTPPGGAPFNVLVPAKGEEIDRRLRVIEAPSYGIVGKTTTLRVAIEDLGVPHSAATANLTIRRDGEPPRVENVPVGTEQRIDLPISRAGPTVVELAASTLPGEVSIINNRAVIEINGVRDRLRVLLISGEPHPGERTWRRLLKADPSVDLVHFTILRPPEKQDGTPINELSLIAFPIRELFQVKLHDFDLIIFDRYRQQNILPRLYIQAIADYVENGGAILEAAGPTDATGLSLYYTPLGTVLPGEPSGKVLEQPFKPTLTDIGRRHPVTADLPGAGPQGGNPSWGKWMRQIEITPLRGETLMSGADNEPLLVLDRVGQGRVAQLASDHIWLWSRGYDGGGPQAELLRRLAHWLMKEPDLEEEDLKAVLQGGKIMVTRRSLQAGGAEVTVTDPLDNKRTLQLEETAPGRATGELPVTVPGLYRVEDGKHTALAAIGAINPKEFADVRATESLLQPMTDGSGGGQFWLGQGTPSLRRVGEDRVAHGRDWLGLVAHHDYDVVGIEQVPLLPAAAVLLLGIGGLMLAWRREGK